MADKSCAAVFGELIKARLTFLVLLTTLAGFYVGQIGPLDFVLLFHTLLGTALVAISTSKYLATSCFRFPARCQGAFARPLAVTPNDATENPTYIYTKDDVVFAIAPGGEGPLTDAQLMEVFQKLP